MRSKNHEVKVVQVVRKNLCNNHPALATDTDELEATTRAIVETRLKMDDDMHKIQTEFWVRLAGTARDGKDAFVTYFQAGGFKVDFPLGEKDPLLACVLRPPRPDGSKS